jgi:hypothetical protein
MQRTSWERRDLNIEADFRAEGRMAAFHDYHGTLVDSIAAMAGNKTKNVLGIAGDLRAVDFENCGAGGADYSVQNSCFRSEGRGKEWRCLRKLIRHKCLQFQFQRRH